jgi:membrane protease YdiL (CAAX protease family)
VTIATTLGTGQLETDALPRRAAAIGLLVPALLFTVLPALTGLDGSTGPIALSNAHLVRSLALEFLLSVGFGVWLWRLGWRPQRTATRPFAPADLLRGLGLWAVAIGAVVCWALVCRILLPDVFAAATEARITGRLHLSIVVPFVLFNAVFEELLWLGLGFAAFQRLGIGWAGGLSAGLRIMIHAYQGPLAVITIVPMAVLFTVYYIRTRRLWPIIVAHAFQDLLSLGMLAVGVVERRPV